MVFCEFLDLVYYVKKCICFEFLIRIIVFYDGSVYFCY